MTTTPLHFLKTSFLLMAVSFVMLTGCHTDDYTNTEKHYGKEVERLATLFNMPPEYFKALIVLECSGKKEVPPRFEKHIYERLKKVKQGKMKSYENIRAVDLKNASDEALRNLASSWGPFQLMGYKCLHLGVNVKDIRGEEALYWGFYWIDQTYGSYIRQKKFKEAFSIHNTGSPTGRTHNPEYATKGLAHMAHFGGER